MANDKSVTFTISRTSLLRAVAGIGLGLILAVIAIYLLSRPVSDGDADAPSTAGSTDAADAAAPPAKPKPVFPHMKLEAIYGGPLEDTVIQRWRDPIDGRVCYIYLPVRVKRQPVVDSNLVDYGNNTIGSISCTAGPDVAPPKPAQ
ncbi:MAG: hypothetical protein JSR60_01520 [Proteobacteria bacterium]|nr:hypothetical protein [Pseudomonadota bacterium]